MSLKERNKINVVPCLASYLAHAPQHGTTTSNGANPAAAQSARPKVVEEPPLGRAAQVADALDAHLLLDDPGE